MPRTYMNVNKVMSTNYFRRRLWHVVNGVHLLVLNEYTPNATQVHLQKVRDTSNTPNFRSLAPSKRPMRPFTYLEQRSVYPEGTSEIWVDGSPDTYSLDEGMIPVTPYHDSLGITDALKTSIESQALNKSLTDLKGMKVNLGVAMAERQRTSNLILRTAGKIGNSLRSLKKGNFTGAAKALGIDPKRGVNRSGSKALADEWLALQYGWKPLLSDVYNAAEELARISKEPRKFRVSSSKTVWWNKSYQVGQWNSVPVIKRDFGRYSCKYVYIFSYSNEVVTDLSRFGVTNPAAIAWEILPWSFVIDWFIPIGNYIDTWDATLGFSFEKGCKTTFEKWNTMSKANGTVFLSPHTRRVNAQASKEYVRCDRVPLASFPLPRLPTFDPRLSFNKGVTTAALLRQRLKL